MLDCINEKKSKSIVRHVMNILTKTKVLLYYLQYKLFKINSIPFLVSIIGVCMLELIITCGATI